jgi:Fe-S-cluster containining protein
MPQVLFVPWRQASCWRCVSCGRCCKDYSVVLNFAEWLMITQTFGVQTTTACKDKLFLKRSYDGTCAFLSKFGENSLCALQNMKPNACKIWPFKVLAEPKYGEPKKAVFDFAGKNLFIYADSNCCGLKYGNPTWDFSRETLREFAGIALGLCEYQHNSTRHFTGYGRRIV